MTSKYKAAFEDEPDEGPTDTRPKSTVSQTGSQAGCALPFPFPFHRRIGHFLRQKHLPIGDFVPFLTSISHPIIRQYRIDSTVAFTGRRLTRRVP